MGLVSGIDVPLQVLELVDKLNAYSYRAYIVGKCVRELVSGRETESSVDFDIITNAEIDRICAIFDVFNINDDNIKKGEVIVTVLGGMPVLIAPYRKGFNPDGSPVYTKFITEDLQRRDFSFDAIAYHPDEGFIDPFGGLACLEGETSVVSAIFIKNENEDGEDISPFENNPVSILKALKFYSSGDYVISPETHTALIKNKKNVTNIFMDETRAELNNVLLGKKVSVVLEEYEKIFFELIPELALLNGFDLKRPEYTLDAVTHTFRSVGYASPILILRYAMLFHALGKPDCFSEDASGKGHYYGHAERSCIYAERIMKRMGFSEDEIDTVSFIIRNQDVEIAEDKHSLKLKLRKTPPEQMKLLLQFKYANLKAQSPEFESKAMACKKQVDVINEIVTMKECYTIGQLAVSRSDLIQKNIARGNEQVTAVLERLLDMVLDSPNFNTRVRLLTAAEKIMKDVNKK